MSLDAGSPLDGFWGLHVYEICEIWPFEGRQTLPARKNYLRERWL